jgi:CubicO group peptidase (beta-lactamase class C family)
MLRIALLISTALLTSCGARQTPSDLPAAVPPVRSQVIAAGVTPAQVEAVDRLLARYGPATPGAVVAVVRGGELVFARGYGMADLSHGIPFDARTITNIGSTAKQFTAFGILLLEQQGRLSLDDDVRAHVPELPDFGPTVRLRHLLNHTSGYREFVNLLMLSGRRVLEGDYIDRAELIEVVQRQPRLQNEPGAEFNYNNTGYGLLALVIERVAGVGFDHWLAQEVFRPLGMTDTRVRQQNGQVIPRRAAGYLGAPGDFQETRDVPAAVGAGVVYTTVADLARWLRNFRTAELGGPDVIAAMTTPAVLMSGVPMQYGLGLMIDRDRGLRRWHHGGGDLAHRSHFHYYPDLDAGYMVLSNDASFPANAAAAIGRIFFGEHMTAPPPPQAAADVEPTHAVPASLLDRYVGRYALDPMPSLVLTITREDDQLRAQATGQQAVDLRALNDTSFALAGAPIRITFHVDEDSAVRRLTLHQNGDHGATRLADRPPADLAAYAGRYFSRELESFYTLTVDEGRLVVHQRRIGSLPLTHQEADRFGGPMPLMEVAFERDDAGRVTGFRVNAGGRTRDVLFERRE